MLVFVGTYTDPILFGTGKTLQGKGEGIYAYRLDSSSGGLELVGKTTGVTNPSYLAFDATGRFLYAVNELKTFEGRPTGTVSAFAVEATTGRLAFLNRQLTHGTDPCHVLVDQRRKHVFVANFMSGSVCVLPVRDDGSLAEASDFIQHQGSGIDPTRQKGPHAHSVTLDAANRFAFVPDLGLDRLMVYAFDRAGNARSECGALDQDETGRRSALTCRLLPAAGMPTWSTSSIRRWRRWRTTAKPEPSGTCRRCRPFRRVSPARAPAPTSRLRRRGRFSTPRTAGTTAS
jgi:6-phosphogluconolactonase (cycloisomerase 2 family)